MSDPQASGTVITSDLLNANQDELVKLLASYEADKAARQAPPTPVRGTLDKLAFFVRTGWRPAAGWVSATILLVNGVVIPLARLWLPRIEPVDWRAMTPFVVVLLGHAALRTWEKIAGASE